MDHLPLNHILYLGRNDGLANSLRSILTREFVGDNALVADSDALRWSIATNQKAALRCINGNPPQIILVKTIAHVASRRHFCESVRLRLPQTAIVAVGVIAAYQFGFDAIIQTPLDSAQAIQALRSLKLNPAGQSVTCGAFQLVIHSRLLTTPLGQQTLTPKQCALLQLFMTHPNRVIKRADIMRTIWDTSYLDDTRTLDVHIRWLREIIEPDPSNPIYLVTRRGVGYQFVTPDEPAAVE